MTMETITNRELLRFAVMTAITCRKCGRILDVRSAVSIGYDGHEFIQCASCYDAIKAALHNVATANGRSLEILDGRELYGRKQPRKAAAKS